jgi:ABC exporter DevA family ATP-binding subunit
MTTVIAVRELAKTYGTKAAAVHALYDVNLEVSNGELLVLMGPSGSGKTTLLSIMGCILRPTSGSVTIGGVDVSGLVEKELPRVRRERIGFIFQDFNLFPTLTAGENLELALDLKGVQRDPARQVAQAWLEQVGLGDKYNTFPSDLSGGERQRVAIARALAVEPDILLADEPTAALDAQSGAEVIDLLRRLARDNGRAVVIVTHDERTLKFADRVVYIEDGRIKGERILAADTPPRWNPSSGRVGSSAETELTMKKNKRNLAIATMMLGAALAAKLLLVKGSEASYQADLRTPNASHSEVADTDLIAGPGRVEPLSEELHVGSEINGKIKAILVEEGDVVERGQVLAVLQNDDYRAQLVSAKAALAARDADLRKVVNGARAEARQEALAFMQEAGAIMENASAEMKRRQMLYQAQVVSREEADHYERQFNVARARYEEAAERYALLDHPAREEDVSRAQAEVDLARAQLDDARARYEKTFIRSPIDGLILRKHHRLGESVTNSSVSPDPIVTLGSDRVLRVRVDVDEHDVAHVHTGDLAYVTADAFGKTQFRGHVVQVGQEMGPKNIRTDEPTERVDKKILETLVQLDDGRELPVGLRVDAFILTRRSAGLAR